MSKKAKKSKQHKSNQLTVQSSQRVAYLIDQINAQLDEGNSGSVIERCQALLSYLPPKAPQRIAVLDCLGVAHAQLQNFPEAYDAYTEVLALEPNNAEAWYNRGLMSRFTSRMGQSMLDFEHALELLGTSELAKQCKDELKTSREIAQHEMKTRGPDFTLKQLIEQEELHQQGLKMIGVRKWGEAEQIFRRVIAMGDGLPQPWGNLAMSLIFQLRFDEGEAALKRALEVDPAYEFARHNLELLPGIRENGLPEMGYITDPFRDKLIPHQIIPRRR